MTATMPRTHRADALRLLSILGKPDVTVLEALGLITGEPGARRVAEVHADTTNLPVPSAKPTVVPYGATWQSNERDKVGFTTPPGLRDLPPVAVTPQHSPAQGKGHGNATFALLAANDRKKAPCGGKVALGRHRRNGETCEVCEAAETERKATSPRRRPECGEPGGLMAHRHRGEPIDQLCRDAHNQRARERKAEQKETAA